MNHRRRYVLGMELDLICPERLRLLRCAKDAINLHSEVVVGLRDVIGCPEIFEAFMGAVKVSSGRVKQAFKAYDDHLYSHGCHLVKDAAAARLPNAGSDGVLAAMQQPQHHAAIRR